MVHHIVNLLIKFRYLFLFFLLAKQLNVDYASSFSTNLCCCWNSPVHLMLSSFSFFFFTLSINDNPAVDFFFLSSGPEGKPSWSSRAAKVVEMETSQPPASFVLPSLPSSFLPPVCYRCGQWEIRQPGFSSSIGFQISDSAGSKRFP